MTDDDVQRPPAPGENDSAGGDGRAPDDACEPAAGESCAERIRQDEAILARADAALPGAMMVAEAAMAEELAAGPAARATRRHGRPAGRRRRPRPGPPAQVVDPRRRQPRHVHGTARRHHRQHRDPGDPRRPGHDGQQGLVGDQRLQPCAGGPLPLHGPRLGQVRAEARVRRRRRAVHDLLAALRPGPEHRVAGHLPHRPGRRRRGDGADLARDPARRLSAPPARHGGGPLGRHGDGRRRGGSDPRRPAHRVPLAGTGSSSSTSRWASPPWRWPCC